MNKYKDCTEKSIIRAKNDSFISNPDSIQLIMLYTSSLKVKGKK
jgi:hypothetical protein